MQDRITWMERFNQGRTEDEKVGFYGLDVYSLWDSLRAVMRYLKEQGDPQMLSAARRAVRCFEPYVEDAQDYARHTVLVPEGCRDQVVNLLRELRARAPKVEEDGKDAFFVAEQNALV